MIKRILCLFVIFTLVMSSVPAMELTASAKIMGKCGANLTWILDDDGTLTISGTGAMTDWTYSSAPWYSNKSKIKTVTITDGVTTIGSRAFEYCYNLTSVTIPDSVTAIGDIAFFSCDSLTSVTIPDSVTTIGDSAFLHCVSLTSMTIPDSVTTIGRSAFSWCDSLTYINVDENNPLYTSIDGILFNKSKTELIQYAIGKTDTEYSIPEDVTTIGDSAFLHCDSLKSITIPNSVIKIGNSAFSYCNSLTSITIPNGVNTIDHNAFYNCDNLTNVTIPNSVVTIGYTAFAECESLISIDVDEYNQSYSSFDGSLFNKSKTVLIQYAIGKTADNYLIPDTVIRIDDYAFSFCDSLTSITIPNSVTTIGDGAFHLCDSLTDVYYTGTEDEWNNINIGANNDSLVNAIIYWNDTIANGICGDSLIWKINDKGTLTVSGTGAMTDWTSASAVPWYSQRSSIKSVKISSGVTTVGDNAFYYCSALSDISLPGGLVSIGNSAFSNCGSISGITIPDSVTTIGDSAFYECNGLISITIPRNVTTIGDKAFSDCNSLISLDVDENNQSYSSIEGNLFDKSKTELIQYATGKTDTGYSVPSTVATIGEWAFAYCSYLTDITIPDSVTAIGNGAFSNCSGLTDITISDNVTSIGSFAFSGCSGLSHITVGNGLKTIGYYAFSGCNKLADVYYTGTEAEWNSINFGTGNDKLINASIHYNSSALADSIDNVTCSYTNGKITAAVTFDKITQPGRLYMAVYDGLGCLVSLSETDITADMEEYTMNSAEVSGSPRVKFFVIDGNVTLAKPLSKAYDYGVFEIAQ